MRFATIADKQQIEDICNNPLLRVWTAFEGAPACVADKYLTPSSKVILGDEGCFLLQYLDPGRYVVHTNLLPTCRGAAALKAIMEALRMMFIQTDAIEIMTMVPLTTPQAKFMATHVGFRYRFTREKLWPAGGERRDLEFFSLHLDDWIASQGEIENSFIHATCAMMDSGNIGKATETWNRFARFAMYPLVEEAQLFQKKEELCLNK